MSDMKRVNPELVKKAAELAKPGPWKHIDGCVAMEGTYDAWPEFNPLKSDADAWALERALKREGFCFGSWPDGRAWAENRRMMIERMDDPSDTLLLLKCVSAMTSLPLYAEESMG